MLMSAEDLEAKKEIAKIKTQRIEGKPIKIVDNETKNITNEEKDQKEQEAFENEVREDIKRRRLS